jgi:hypothetical protein
MDRMTKTALAVLLAAAVLTTTGCFRRVPIERMDESGTAAKSVPLGTAAAMTATVSMGAGELSIAGGAPAGEALAGDFEYAPKSLEPMVTSETSGDELKVEVRHPEVDRLPLVNLKSNWDIRLTNDVPTDLVLNMGAGDANVDLSDVDVTDLAINLGAGQSDIDLTGERTREVRGRIQAGVGELVVRLPKDVPVRVTGIRDGIGDWSADGFTSDGSVVVNEAWEAQGSSAEANEGSIELVVQRGIGEVRLELE